MLKGTVLCKKTLANGTAALIGCLTTLVTALLALSTSDATAVSSRDDMCSLTAVQAGSIRAAMAERNMACAGVSVKVVCV